MGVPHAYRGKKEKRDWEGDEHDRASGRDITNVGDERERARRKSRQVRGSLT